MRMTWLKICADLWRKCKGITYLENKYFNQALSNFVHDMASGEAIRHLADLGYTVEHIVQELDYPTPKERVARTVWDYYVEKGIILLVEPSENPVVEQVTYEKQTGRYGAVHFIEKRKMVDNPIKKYLPCDFGRQRYQDESAFMEKLNLLWKSDREYISGLPWPLKRVYHVADERMSRIYEAWNED